MGRSHGLRPLIRGGAGSRGAARTAALLALWLGAGCLVQGARLERPPPTSSVEVERSNHPGGQHLRREAQVLVWSDGRRERHGFEREYFPDGTLREERFYEHDRSTGVWRSWYRDATPRSEVDFGDGRAPAPSRYWHPGGQLAAEGPTLAGIRVGHWDFWSESGEPLRAGSYVDGLRDGHWTFWEDGLLSAEGDYRAGQRVGRWRIRDEAGQLQERDAGEARVREDGRGGP